MKQSVDRNELKVWDKKENRIEAAHLLDQINAVLNEESRQITPFLSLAMREWVESVLRRVGLDCTVWGGFPEAERVRFLLGAKIEQVTAEDMKLSILWVRPKNPRIQLEHSQILGSLMGLGFKREVLGDIQKGKTGFYLAVAIEITSYLLNYWTKVGRETIAVSLVEDGPDLAQEQGEIRRITVSSSRIDAVIASAFGISRSKAREYISSGKVKKGGLAVSKADAEVQSDDMISCRGYGRIKLLESSVTRKERIGWQIVLFRSRQ